MKIENTDALSFLKSLDKGSVDLILTDPPYAISRETNFQSGDLKNDDRDRFRVSFEFGQWDQVDSEYFAEMCKEYFRVLRKGGSCVIFYDMWKMQELKGWLEDAGFTMFRKCSWDKTNPVPLNRKVFYLTGAREEFIVCVKGGKPTYNMHWIPEENKNDKNIPYSKQDKGILEYPICHDKDRWHPTQKPLALMEELVQIHSNEGDVVLDTFLGSGTTAAAAINLNRTPWGCELSPEYFSKIMDRLTVK